MWVLLLGAIPNIWLALWHSLPHQYNVVVEFLTANVPLHDIIRYSSIASAFNVGICINSANSADRRVTLQGFLPNWISISTPFAKPGHYSVVMTILIVEWYFNAYRSEIPVEGLKSAKDFSIIFVAFITTSLVFKIGRRAFNRIPIEIIVTLFDNVISSVWVVSIAKANHTMEPSSLCSLGVSFCIDWFILSFPTAIRGISKKIILMIIVSRMILRSWFHYSYTAVVELLFVVVTFATIDDVLETFPTALMNASTRLWTVLMNKFLTVRRRNPSEDFDIEANREEADWIIFPAYDTEVELPDLVELPFKMVKRTIKKKKSGKRDEGMEDPIAGMRSSAIDDSDIDEDRPVADLTDVPAPEIEFEMPSLTPMALYGVKGRTSSQSGLSIAVLNNQIVGLRAVVNKTRVRLSQKLIRTRKQLAKQLEKKDNPKLKKKVERITEELDVLKNIPKDDVSKFALLNQKALTQLPLSPETPLGERCLYRLACEKSIVMAVTKFREEFEDWESTIPSLLQRLGHQSDSSTEKDCKTKKPVKAQEPPAEVDDDTDEPETAENSSEQSENNDSDADDVTDDDQAEGSDISDVDMGTDSDDEAEETVAKRRALLLGLANIKEEKSRHKPVPSKRKIVVPSDEEDANEELPAKKSAKSVSNQKEKAVSAVTDILQKAIKESKLSLAKKAKNVKQPATVPMVSVPAPSLKGMKVSNQSAVKQVKLSDAGEVKFAKKTAVKKQQPKPVPNEDSDQSDEKETTSSFFLSADAPSPADSGEESADDDADIQVNPVPKKGGVMRQMSSTREKFHQRLEERPMKKQMGNAAKKSFGSNDRNIPSKGPSSLPEELHPSWIAKRLAKEQQNARPQGKKTVFADDD